MWDIKDWRLDIQLEALGSQPICLILAFDLKCDRHLADVVHGENVGQPGFQLRCVGIQRMSEHTLPASWRFLP